MPPKSRSAAKLAEPHAADQLVAPPHIIATVRRLLSSAPLKARSSEILECLQGIDWADADVEFQRVQSLEFACMADADGDHDADVKEFVLFLICRKLLKQQMSMLSFCYTFGKCLCKWLRCIMQYCQRRSRASRTGPRLLLTQVVGGAAWHPRHGHMSHVPARRCGQPGARG